MGCSSPGVAGGNKQQQQTAATAPTLANNEVTTNQNIRTDLLNKSEPNIGVARQKLADQQARTDDLNAAIKSGVGDVNNQTSELENINRNSVTDSTNGWGREQYQSIYDNAPNGWGRDEYANFAKTGGFTPESEASFMRSGTRPTAAIYSNLKDSLARQNASANGDFTSSAARIARQSANAGAEAGTNTRVALENQKRQGQEFGISGLESTRKDINNAQMGATQGLESTRQKIGNEQLAKLQQMQQEGRLLNDQRLRSVGALQANLSNGSGQEAQAANQVNEEEQRRLSTAISTGQLTAQDIQILAGLRQTQPSIFQTIMTGIQTGAGAAAGILGGM